MASEKITRWIPLESNPDVLNSWSSKVGLDTEKDFFSDIYGLDDDELLSMVPKPVKAVILLFPITENLEVIKAREDQDASLLSVAPSVIWIKQRISNACGTMGLLHALLNSNVTINPGSPLKEFLEQCKDKSPEQRAELLETTTLFADVHKTEASAGQSSIPENLDTNYHFTCFVQGPSAQGGEGLRLIELDGRRAGPIDRGASTDLLKDAATFVTERFVHGGGIDLSMMALSGTADAPASAGAGEDTADAPASAGEGMV